MLFNPLLIVIVITVEHLADAFGAPGVLFPVVEHARPALDIRDGLGNGCGLALGRRSAKGRAVGGDCGMFGGR